MIGNGRTVVIQDDHVYWADIDGVVQRGTTRRLQLTFSEYSGRFHLVPLHHHAGNR